jgi:hypothetical protein
LNHLFRFKIVYAQALIAFASALAGELEGLKGHTREQLAALTWVFWIVSSANIVVACGNTIVASFQHAPEPKPSTAIDSMSPTR